MRSIPVQELLVGPSAMICGVVGCVAAILDMPQDVLPVSAAVARVSR